MTKRMTVEGMMCGMCEAHVCDALRKVPGVEKASASRKKKQAVVQCDGSVSDEELLQAVNATGYIASDVQETEEKKSGGFLGFLHK